MGFSLKHLVADVNPFDGPQRPQPASTARPNVAPQVQQAITHAKYGVLANNPQAQSKFLDFANSRQSNISKAFDYNDAFNKAVETNVVQPFVTKPIAEIIATARNKSFQPSNNELGKQLFGTGPIKPIQQDVKGVYDVNRHFGAVPAGVLAAGDLGMHVAQDLPFVGGSIKGAKAVTKALEPTYNGLKASQVIMDTSKLDTLNNAREMLAAGKAPAATRNAVTQGLHQINQDHNLDFISGSPASRVQRINQYLEQNGEAIPQLQAHQTKVQNFRANAMALQDKLPVGLTTKAVNDQGERVSALTGKSFKNTEVPTVTNSDPQLPTTPGGVAPTKLVPQSSLKAQEAQPVRPTQLVPAQDEASLPTVQQDPIPRTAQRGIQESVNPKPLSAEDVASLPANRTTQVGLNTDRLNAPDLHKNTLSAETSGIIEKMSNDDVQRIAKSAGLDNKSYNIQQTRQKIAEQLNVRQNAVMLQRQAEEARQAGDTERAANLLKQSADAGRTSRSQGTDLARQLQARRIIANELDSPQQRIFKLLDNAGVNPDVYTKRLANVNFNNAQEVVDAYRDLVPAKFGDWLDKFRYTNMLSSPTTQITNVVGNAQGAALIRPLQKGFEGVVDALHAGVTGQQRTRTIGEAGSYIKGISTSLPESIKAFGNVMSGKSLQNNPDFGDLAHSPLATKGVKGVADKVLSFIPKVMEAFDEAGQAQIRKGETAALKYRESKGINPGDITQKSQDAADYVLFRGDLGDPSQGHLLNAIDFIPQKVQEARNSANPIIRNASKLVFPFVKTPTNVSKQMIEYSPLGVLTLAGNADKTAQVAKAVMGTTLTSTAAGYLAAENRLTFAQPTDAKEKQKFLAEGKQAYSFKVGNKWISYQRLHPALAFNLAAVAAVNDALRNKKMNQSTADATLTGLASVSRFFIDQSYFKNAQDFLNNASGSGSIGSQATTALASQGSNIANQFVPARAALTWLNNFIDKTQRQPDNSVSAVQQFKQQFSSQLPGLSKSVPARKDNLGNDLQKQHPVINSLSPARISDEKNDNIKAINALTGEVERLARQDNTIALTNQSSAQKIAGTDVNLNPKQTKDLTNQVNTNVKNGWNKLIATPEYKVLSDEDKRHALSSYKTDATSAIKRQFGSSNNIALKDKASKSDIAILNNKVDYASYAKSKNSNGSYVADNINKSVDSTNKKFLTNYESMSADDRIKAATTQNDFEYKLAQAQYANNKANGKLSTAQDIKARAALVKAKAGSSFDQNTRQLYGLTNDELYNYVSNDPNGKKIAADVIAYGDALAKAGAESNNKFRDKKGNITLADSTTTTSKTGSKKSGKFDYSKKLASTSASTKALQALLGKSRIKARKIKKPKLKVA